MNNKMEIILVGELGPPHERYVDHCIERITKIEINVVYVYVDSIGGVSQTSVNIFLKLKKLKKQGVEFHTVGNNSVKSGALLIFLLGVSRLLMPGTEVMYHHHGKMITLNGKMSSRKGLYLLLGKEGYIEQLRRIEGLNRKIDAEIILVTGMTIERLREIEEINLDVAEAINFKFATGTKNNF